MDTIRIIMIVIKVPVKELEAHHFQCLGNKSPKNPTKLNRNKSKNVIERVLPLCWN